MNIQALSSFCLNESSLKTKIALRTFYKVIYPAWTEKIILIIEYLHLISQLILSSSFSYESWHHPFYIFQMIIYALKLINPSCLVDYQSSKSTIYVILAMILCGTLVKILLFAHVVYASWRNKEINSWLECLWRWIYKSQMRVLYFTFTSFWIKAIIETRDGDFSLFGAGKGFTVFVSSMVLVLEFLFSFILETQFCYFLPNKSFLSSKNNQLQMTTFLQKFLIQIFLLSLKSDSETLAWLTVAFGILFDIKRFCTFFTRLPLHSLKASVSQGILQSIVLACSLAKFLNLALKTHNYEGASVNLVIITWILLALLICKISYEILKFQILLLLTTANNGEIFPEKLLHKVSITNELRKYDKIPTATTSNYAFDHLVLLSQNLKFPEIFGVDLDLEENFSDDDKKFDKIYLLFYQQLLQRHPKNSLIRLYVAHRSFKNSEPYAKIIKLTHGLQQSKWSQNSLSCSLLVHGIEKSMRETQKGGLDLHAYIKSKIHVDDVKSDMLKQTDFQINVCQTMLHHNPNIGNIHNFAQKISHFKTLIKKKIDHLTHVLPEYYISPYLCYAEYNLATNYSKVDFAKYCEIYGQKYSKTQRFFNESTLMKENLYQDSNAFLLISIQQSADYGEISYYTKSLENLCGSTNLKIYQNMHISTLFSPSLREHYNNAFNQIKQELMNSIHRVYLHNEGGYLTEADFCLKYHPYLNQGLCLNMILRPVPVSPKMNFLLLRENGEIEGTSKELAWLIDLPKTTGGVPVRALSEELDIAITAFNIIRQEKQEESVKTRPRQTHNMSYDKAVEIWSAFTSEEQEIQLSFENNSTEVYTFFARVETKNYGNITMNLVRLRTSSGDLEDDLILKMNKEIRSSSESENILQEIEDYFPPILTDYNQQQSTFVSSPRQPETERHFLTDRTEKILPQKLQKKKTLKIPKLKDSDLEHFPVGRKTTKLKKPSSKSSQKSEENRDFINAILYKSYPKSFIILCFAFYLVILINFGGQIIMKSVSDNTMKNLQIRKNILEHAQERAYKGALIQLNSIGSAAQISGYNTEGGAIPNVDSVVVNLQIRVSDMKAANDKMLNYVYSLDKETQGQLFAADILVNGTFLDSEDDTYKYVNSFQLTREVVNAVHALKGLANPTSAQGYYIFDYLAKNLLNDFLYKSTQISTLLTVIVSQQKESFQNITTLFFVLGPLLLAGIGIMLIFIIWNQYRIEKQNMKAVIKIPSKGIKIIADGLVKFREELIKEDSFEKKLFFENATRDLQSLSDVTKTQTSAYSKGAETKEIRYKEARKRYYGYISRVFLCIFALVAILIWDMIVTKRAIRVIYNRQSQLEFANYISDRTTLVYIAMNPLFTSNNTWKVEHKLPNVTLLNVMDEIKEIQSQISQRFLEVDGNYNPQVRSILFEDNSECEGFNDQFIIYCKFLVNLGQPVYMMSTIASYQEKLKMKYQDYLSANKSTQKTITAALTININPALAIFGVLSQEAQMIVNIMDKSMGEKISEMQNSRNTIIIIFSVSLFVVSFLIWFYILKVIREVHNDFKKVLQLFPSYLVLSSYLLNKFLQETSHK